MDNYAVADQLSLLAKLMDIHGENSFKSKSYASAAFAVEKLPQEIASLPQQKIFAIKGIGESVGNKIVELLQTGSLQQLQEYIDRTPPGVLEMMNIKGLGPKKIHTVWKEMGIDTIEALRTACETNQIAAAKGFGAKTEQNILEAIAFQQSNAGRYLYAQLEAFAEALTLKLREKFPAEKLELTGDYRRQLDVIESLDWVTTASPAALSEFLSSEEVQLVTDRDGLLVFKAENALVLRFVLTDAEHFYSRLFATTGSPEFQAAWERQQAIPANAASEEAIFEGAGLSYIPPFLRERESDLQKWGRQKAEGLIQTHDIRGLIHSHSNWSDGGYTIEAMAEELIRLGFEYMVISDHSKAAFYANGLSEERIREQHRYIDSLNERYAPFRIFKSIECDILNDGSLDYENKILSTFDLVITSVHSNLDMDEEKAMKRLLGAITNPYTTILGHMTGRILLRRKGYPVDHRAVIDACAAHNVAIEINASPSRLDIDWRWVDYALEKGVLLSVNPDAHTLEEFPNIRYGVLVGQKGGLRPEKNLSSFTLQQFESFLTENKKAKGLSR